MKIYKFGGASVKDADSVRNVGRILKAAGNSPVLTVVSAMGKTTNKLEALTRAIHQGSPEARDILAEVRDFHLQITRELVDDAFNPVHNDTMNFFLELECLLETHVEGDDYDALYDTVVGYGELISTRIISNYLLHAGTPNHWLDARNFILTDDRHREGRVQWNETGSLVRRMIAPLAHKSLVITQGFIGKTRQGAPTTLGREGSDYSAAIFAWALKAEEVSIWKDVPGVMNADPRRFPFAEPIASISYADATELAYYGASVIHPKTIQPLQQAGIPLYVRSFIDPGIPGTVVGLNDRPLEVPCYIVKDRQCLLNVRSGDFNFIAEDHLSAIFSTMATHRIRANVMQHSALSFSVCTDEQPERLNACMNALQNLGFETALTENLSLLTVYNRQHDQHTAGILHGRDILMEQILAHTVQYVLR